MIAAKDLARVLGKQAQDRELLRGQSHRPSLHPGFLRLQVQLQAVEPQNVALIIGRAADSRTAKDSLDAGHHLARRRGFDDVIVGPESQTTGSPGPTAAQLTGCIKAHGVTVARSMPLKAWLQSAVSDPNDSNALTACGLDSGSPISK